MVKRGSTKDWNRQKWQKSALVDFQKMVRMTAADSEGYCVCCTCGVRRHYKTMDAGHFISRKHNATAFDSMNCHPQCKKCNLYLDGNQIAYYQYMEQSHGRTMINRLIQQSKTPRIYTIDELREMRAEFRRMWKRAQETKNL